MLNPFKKKSDGGRDSSFRGRILHLEVVEATDLLEVSKSAGLQNTTFVTVALHDLGHRAIKTETFRSNGVKTSTKPQWNEKFILGTTYKLDSALNLPSVVVNIFSKSVIGVSETPLGSVTIYLETLDQNGESVDMWLPVEKSGRMETVKGQLRVRINFSGPPNELLDESEKHKSFKVSGMEDLITEETEAIPPNELIITVLKARQLLAMDKNLFKSGGSSDPMVRIKINGQTSKETKYIKQTLNPKWDEKIEFAPLLDPQTAITVIVEDHNDFKPTRDFIGKVVIPIREFDDKKVTTKWYKLNNKKNEPDGVDRGEIELAILWRYNPTVAMNSASSQEKFDKSVAGKVTRVLNTVVTKLGIIDEGSDVEDGDDDEVADAPPPEMTAEEKDKKKKEQDVLEKELGDIEIKSGDYQIQVHIIELRDIKAENYDGTSDPTVYIEVFGQKQNTKTMYSVTSAVFDDLFIFNVKSCEKETFSEGIVRISVYDANSNPLQKHKMIGAYSFDTTSVYTSNKNHEIYRQWLPLMDDEDDDDVGVQGYLKASVQIIGPGDKLVVHNEEEDIAKEQAKENAAGGDIGSLVLSTPVIARSWQFVVVSVYRCEALPVMDGKVGGKLLTVQGSKTDAFCQVAVGGAKPLKTKKKTVFGETRDSINPIFNYELWFPVSIPSMTRLIKFSIWDWDPEKNELIGNVVEHMDKLDKAGGRGDVMWYNVYGAPEFKTGQNLADNLVKGAKAVGRLAKTFAGVEDWHAHYNNIPNHASAFKGRALLRFRIESKRPEGKYDTNEIVPFRRKIKPLAKTQEPSSVEYQLQALVISGTELPPFVQGGISAVATVGMKKQDLKVRISIGPYDAITKPAKYEKGMCRWNEFIATPPIKFPALLEQIPDIFIYLVNEDNKPVCFARVKAVDLKKYECIGFQSRVKWFLLREDKVIDALSVDTFPGSVLVQLGFGPAQEAASVVNDWTRSLTLVKAGQSFQVRVHIYQGKNIPPADSNGLADPYVVVTFMGQQAKTKWKEKTLFPSFYETLVFDNVVIPEYESFAYASMVTFRLYDHDNFDSDDYLGTFGYDLKDAIVTPNAEDALPDPKWYEFFREVPGDGDGELLALVQLIPSFGETTKSLKGQKIQSIIPELRDAYVEIVAIGLRDLAPYRFLPIQCPYLEIEMESFGGKYSTSTVISKVPSPQNPNFLERIVLPIKLPINSLYAPPLQIRARDKRLGGLNKPIVGVGIIDISTKIPWCTDTYKPPQSSTFIQNKSVGEVVKENTDASPDQQPPVADSNVQPSLSSIAEEMQQNRLTQAGNDDLIAKLPPLQIDELVRQKEIEDDTGAGVFGAIKHIEIDKNKKRNKNDLLFAHFEDILEDEDDDQPPAWKIGRNVLQSDLESELQTSPFETYPLMRGQKSGLLGSTYKKVGMFKGLVRIMLSADEPPLFPRELMEELFRPQKYKIRLYVLRGIGLTPMDVSIMGRPAKSDPYIKCQLGKFKFNDRKNFILDATDVDLYKCIEMDAELPGTSQLKIDMMDKDDFGEISDDLIGSTTIDLEDRWFDARWQELGSENSILPGQNETNAVATRWCTKPIERRQLMVQNNQAPQGVLECWLDIMKPEAALVFPPDDISLPPKQLFEVRVVIWKCKDVPPQDTFEGMSDLYVKCWPEGCKPQETDTHWRAKKGKASWNWRLKFDVELGQSTRAMKFPYLHLQLWDKDILKWNDCVGEGIINMGPYYRKAYRKNVALKLFEEKKGAAAARDARQAKFEQSKQFKDTTNDIPPLEEGELAQPSSPQSTTNPLLNTDASPSPIFNEASEMDSDDDEDAAATKAAIQTNVETNAAPVLSSKPAEKSEGKIEDDEVPDEAKKGDEKSGWMWGLFAEGKKIDEEKPLLKDGEANEDEDDEVKETKEFVSSVKQLLGLWPDEDPVEPHSWYKLERSDHNGGKPVPMGSICYSVQIWPKAMAEMHPAGAARGEPNNNPFLPPPVGRLQFSWNPFVLGSALCGPKLCFYFSCCLICAAFIVLMIFCQPFLNIVINLVFITFGQN